MTNREFLSFVIGLAIGVVSSALYFRGKTQEEINEVRSFYLSKVGENEATENTEAETVEEKVFREFNATKPEIRDYINTLRERKYVDYSKTAEPDDSSAKVPDVIADPYVISIDDFGQEEGYDTITLTAYSDGTIANYADDELEDPESTIGEDILSKFGDEDVVYIRNDRLKADFEVVRDNRTYVEVIGDFPTEGV